MFSYSILLWVDVVGFHSFTLISRDNFKLVWRGDTNPNPFNHIRRGVLSDPPGCSQMSFSSCWYQTCRYGRGQAPVTATYNWAVNAEEGVSYPGCIYSHGTMIDSSGALFLRIESYARTFGSVSHSKAHFQFFSTSFLISWGMSWLVLLWPRSWTEKSTAPCGCPLFRSFNTVCSKPVF